MRSEFPSLERQAQNCNVWKDRARIPMLGRARPQFQSLEGYGQNSIFERIGHEFKCLEG